MSYSSDSTILYGPGSDANDEIAKALLRRQQYLLGNVPAGVIAGVSPVGENEQGQTTYGAPGIANAIYSGLGRGAQWLTNLGLKSAAGEATAYTSPYTGGEQVVAPQIGSLPGVEAAERKLGEQERFGERMQAKVAPPPVPETREDLVDAAIGKAVGESIIPIPGAAYTRLPTALSAPLRMLAPTVKEAPLVAGATAALGYGADAKAQADEKAKPYSPGVVHIDPTSGEQTAAPTQDSNTWTLPEVLGAGGVSLAGLWALSKFGGRGLNHAIDLLHDIPRDPAAVSKVIDDIKAGRGSASVTGGDIPEMPLPANAGDFTHRWARNWLNPNAVLNQTARGITAHADEAEALINHNNMINYPAGQARQMESQFRTGISPTGRQGPSQYDMRMMVDGMTDGQRQIANDAAWARSELDNRQASGGQPVHYPNNDDATLQQMVARGNQDPLVRAFLGHINATQQFMVDDMMRMGVVTRQQAAHALATQPNFMPTFDIEGNLQHSWTGRDVSPGTGLDRPALPAWEAMSMYYDQAYRKAIHEKFVSDWVQRLHQFSQSNPDYRNLVVERRQPGVGHNQGPPLEGSLGPTIEIKTPTGPRYFDVNNSTLRDSLKTNPSNMQLLPSTANWQRRIFQAGTTGPLAGLGGSLFAAKNFIRDAMLIPVQSSKGYKTGLGFVPGSAMTAVRDAGSVLNKHFADALASKDHPFTQMLYGTIGGQRTEALRKLLNARYLNSNLERRTALGVGGGGQAGISEASSRLAGSSTKTYRDPLSTVAPLVARPKLDAIASKVPLGKSAVTSAINLRQLIHDLHGVVSDAPHSNYFDRNVNNPKIATLPGGKPDLRRLAAEVQQVVGDPTTHGVGVKAQAYSRTTPYFNTALQGMARRFASARDQPLKWAGASAATALTLSLASQLSALVSGKEHTDHLENRIANSKGESNAILYHGPGTDPNVHTELTLPQELRAVKSVMDDVSSATLGTWHAHANEATLTRMKHMLADLFSHHVSTNLAPKVGQAAADEYGYPLQIPPGIAGGISLLTGGDVSDPARKGVKNLIEGNPVTQGMVNTGSQTALPGQEDVSSYVGKKDSQTIQSVLSAILGQAGQGLGEYGANAVSRYQQTHDLGWLARGLKTDIGQKAAEANAYGNILLQKELPMSTRGAGDERVMRAWDQLKPMVNAESKLREQGMTRAGGQQTLVTAGSPLDKITDPQMRQIYMDMSVFAKNMDRHAMPQMNDIYKQMQSVKDSANTATEKRRMLNNLSYDLSEKRRQLEDEVDRFSHHLSVVTGRHVDISRRIDWGRGLDQFPTHYQ